MCSAFIINVFVVLQVLNNILASVPEGLQIQLGSCGTVHLTVSSLQDNYLELNWATKDCNATNRPDYILLTTKNVRDRDEDRFSSSLVQIRASDYPSGYYRTKIKFREPWLPGNWEYNSNTEKVDQGPHCLPYWIASLQYEKIIDSRCLAIQPTWMYDNRQSLGSQKIGNLFIPGTHNSASNKGILTYFEGYVLNQDRSVWNQLVFGIRYLDLRIGYIPDGGFYIYHDHVKVTKMEPVLEEIKKFVELAPQEVLIVDFHRFPFPSNFTKEMHAKLTNLVDDYLGNYVLQPTGLQMGSGPTLNEIWSQNKSVIVCYADRATINHSPWLWQPIKQFWGDTNKVPNLREFLHKSISQHKSFTNPMWALMAELTPQPWDVILRKNNLRDLAQNVNKEVTKWFRDEWFNEANIVATDYFLGNDLIHVAIVGNKANHNYLATVYLNPK